MEFALLGWPEDGPTLDLDHRTFSYAGKFVMSNTGKAVARETDEAGSDDVVGAAAFNGDRTDPDVCWIRYVTVRADRRGEGIGPRLSTFVAERASERGYERARIAVNNPFAYEALYRAGFRFTGEETGVAELVLDRPLDERVDDEARSRATYQAGLDVFRDRDRSTEETAFLDGKRGDGPPPVVDPPE